MNRFKIILLMAIVCSTILSCEKFLDIKKNSNMAIIETAKDCQLLLDNYSLNTNYPNDGEASADDYYVTSKYIDLKQEDKDVYSWATNGIRSGAEPNWKNPYYVIYVANLVLETLENLKPGSADQATINNLKGSALFLRSYSFWQVAQLYAKPYQLSSSETDPGIPLRLSSDINDKSSRGTVKLTYDRIVQDLQEAANLMFAPSVEKPTRPNKAAAYAMLARVYLSMEDYAQALTNANAALLLNNQLMNFNSEGIPVRFNKEVIFHSLMSSSELLNSNEVAMINVELVNSYSTNDLRKGIFVRENMKDIPDPSNPGNTISVPDGTYRFTGNYEASTTNLFNGLAVDELYLIRAESYARGGKLNEALADLNSLLVKRWKTGTYVNLTTSNPQSDTQDEVLSKILEERRKELLMRGLRWTDLRRLNKDSRFAKALVRSGGGINYSLPANDPRYTLLIPQAVINNSSLEQNKR